MTQDRKEIAGLGLVVKVRERRRVASLDLFDVADAALTEERFADALRAAGEILRLRPEQTRARILAARALDGMGHGDHAVSAILSAAKRFLGSGLSLPAVGALCEAYQMRPDDQAVVDALEEAHRAVFGLWPKENPPPPPAPEVTAKEEDEDSVLGIDEDDALVKRALELLDKDEGEARETEPCQVPLLSDLTGESFMSLVKRMRVTSFEAGACILEQGQLGRSLFMLTHGELDVHREVGDQKVRLGGLSVGAVFGELALLTERPRSATVTAKSRVEALELSLDAVEDVARESASITEELASFARRRVLRNLLRTSPVFEPFNEAQKREVLARFVPKVVDAKKTIIAEGEESVGLFLLASGEVEVTKVDVAGDQVLIAELFDGDVFGEIALLEHRKTTATAIARTRSVLMFLERSKFQELIDKYDELKKSLKALSTDRLDALEAAHKSKEILDADDLVIV